MVLINIKRILGILLTFLFLTGFVSGYYVVDVLPVYDSSVVRQANGNNWNLIETGFLYGYRSLFVGQETVFTVTNESVNPNYLVGNSYSLKDNCNSYGFLEEVGHFAEYNWDSLYLNSGTLISVAFAPEDLGPLNGWKCYHTRTISSVGGVDPNIPAFLAQDYGYSFPNATSPGPFIRNITYPNLVPGVVTSSEQVVLNVVAQPYKLVDTVFVVGPMNGANPPQFVSATVFLAASVYTTFNLTREVNPYVGIIPTVYHVGISQSDGIIEWIELVI